MVGKVPLFIPSTLFSPRSGSITVDELKAVCTELGTPISEEEIATLLKE